MIRATGRYHQQSVKLDSPLSLKDGTEVEVVLRVKSDSTESQSMDFTDLGIARMEEEWNNPEDAIYDDWK